MLVPYFHSFACFFEHRHGLSCNCCRRLQNNGLTGDLPGNAVWWKLRFSLTTMYVITCN